ncbi:MAG: UvrD-helicase domain-containing protein [Alphaproteobacteria bacterium]|jgi:DNA helicase-2/ATP-dependent DNA helicase PcrA|nr:UvrD-helicase domain-containing protein [Alphaproteobacteria bacterium]
MFSYLDKLNPEQREAVEQTEGPLLVLAGAGTGKTRVLTTRIAHILYQGKCNPHEIMAVTFTNKASIEMKERVAATLNIPSVEGWMIGTFHSLAVKILRRHIDLIGFKRDFTIIDASDQLRLIKQILKDKKIDDKKYPPKLIAGAIEGFKNKAISSDKISIHDVDDTSIMGIYKEYQTRLKISNACDFGDFLMYNLQIFQSFPEVLKTYQERFKYILVDEYQDTNIAQYLWLRILTQKHKNICCVGDDDQSIYGWRGAEVGNILKFEKDFPNAKTVRLEENYRSTGHILEAASCLIAKNATRLGKTLRTSKGLGEKIKVINSWDGRQEAQNVVKEIDKLKSNAVSYNEMAVLVRTAAQTREFEEVLIQQGIPYKIIGGARFYERKEIRDAIAYLRVINQPSDNMALQRIINTPKRGIGDATIQKINIFARGNEISMFEAIEKIVYTDIISSGVKNKLEAVMKMFHYWREEASQIKHPILLKNVLSQSGYLGALKEDKSLESKGRVENLNELITAIETFDNLQEFLEHVSLVMENQENNNQNKVSLMTLHKAKGLEFDAVFLPGWEEGFFPSPRSIDEGGIEEERRLAHVGITRAKQYLYILHASSRFMFGQYSNPAPSRFLKELSEKNIEKISVFGGSNSYSKVESKDYSFKNITKQTKIDSNKLSKRVFHKKFGMGMVIRKDGDKLDIIFDKSGRKKIMEKFIKYM